MLSFTLKEDMTATDGNHWACTAGGTNGQTVVLSTPCTCENCSLICGLNHWQNCHSPWSCPLEALLSPSGRAWTCQGRLSSTAISTLSLAALLRSKQQIPRRGQDVREGVTHQRRVTQITDSLSMLHRPVFIMWKLVRNENLQASHHSYWVKNSGHGVLQYGF